MFENENDIIQQDANSEETSAPQTQEPKTLETSANEVEGNEQQSEKQMPFHEHPRFKELIERNRQYEERATSYEREMNEIKRQYSEALKAREPQKESNPFVEALSKIDPAYAKWAESVESRASKAESLEKELTEIRQERIRSQYESSLEKLHSENKVPDELKGRIRKEIDYIAMTNPNLGLKDLPNVYKNVFEDYSKFVDSVKRSERASYVTDKSKDASSPSSQPKGKAPTRNEKGQYTGDRDTDLSLVVKRYLKTSKAENDI